MTNNIIKFPIDRRMEEMMWQELEKDLEDKVDPSILVTIDEMLGELIATMAEQNYPIDEEKYIFDISFLYEAIKSLMYKFSNEHHPIQAFAEKLYRDQINAARVASKQLELDFD